MELLQSCTKSSNISWTTNRPPIQLICPFVAGDDCMFVICSSVRKENRMFRKLYFLKDSFNTLRPRRNEQHFADDIFKRIFFNENVWISIKISVKFVPKGPINNITALVQTMAWRRSGDKPLSEPMMVIFTDAYMRNSASMNKWFYLWECWTSVVISSFIWWYHYDLCGNEITSTCYITDISIS